MQKEETHAIITIPGTQSQALLYFRGFSSRVCKNETLAGFPQPFQFDLYKFGYVPKNFRRCPLAEMSSRIAPALMGKQALSTQAWLYQDLWVKWAILQMKDAQNSTADHLLRPGNVPTFSDCQKCAVSFDDQCSVCNMLCGI